MATGIFGWGQLAHLVEGNWYIWLRIITEILEYLSFDDRRRVALVNKTFRYASLHPVLLRRELFVYTAPVQRLRVDDRRRRFKDFKTTALREPWRKLICLKFHGSNRSDFGKAFGNVGGWPPSVVSLHLDSLNWLADSFLDAITGSCVRLEELRLENIGRLCFADKPRRPMLVLRSVRFDKVGVSDECFNVLMACAPNVTDVGINNCQTYDWLDPVHAAVAGISNVGLSDSNIIGYLQSTAAGTVDSLRLNLCCHIFGEIRSRSLRLKSLLLSQNKPYLNTRRMINYEKLESALALQVSLQWLEINHLPARLVGAVSRLHNLRHLTLNLTIGHADMECLREFVESLRDMKRIRTLAVNRVVETSMDVGLNAVLQTFAIPECAFESLTSLDCSLDSSLCVLRTGKRLSSLRIRNGDILSAGDLQLLFENLIGLRHLWIDNCLCLDDDIMSGLPVSNLKGISIKYFTAGNIRAMSD
ncbi:uncharacterized protein LOC111030474 [Myzus persicae]|uniref:uncharacterized protein LOC111030474 n=1 Tax=Myzus persicae TaxID=13164 RepID=UPI000B93590A|nr:uncharacterized protein LOC111030474 [Myzus persicae]